MIDIEREREMVFIKLMRKGPHVLEFSDDYLMVHYSRIALATSPVLERYFSIKNADSLESKCKIIRSVAELIDKEFYCNSALEWYSLREYIENFNLNRLEELKNNINKVS